MSKKKRLILLKIITPMNKMFPNLKHVEIANKFISGKNFEIIRKKK